MDNDSEEFICRGTIKPKLMNHAFIKKKWEGLSLSSQRSGNSHEMNNSKTRKGKPVSAFNDNTQNLEKHIDKRHLEDLFKDSFNCTNFESFKNADVDYFKLICLDNDTINLNSNTNNTWGSEPSITKLPSFEHETKKVKTLLHPKNTDSPSLFSFDSGGSSNLASNKNTVLSSQNFDRTMSFNAEKMNEFEFCTQVLERLDNDVLKAEKENLLKYSNSTTNSSTSNTSFKLPYCSNQKKRCSSEETKPNVKLKKSDTSINDESVKGVIENSIWETDVDFRMTQIFKSSQYRKQVSQLFENLEQSVCEMGVENKNKDITTKWPDDSFLMDTVLNGLTQEASEGSTIGELVKRSLLENATKTVLPSNLVNRTVITTEETFTELGPFYGLPTKVKELIQLYKGIDKLYDWQEECLNLPAVKQRKNLIYSLPTSGGKTLVAEILILREIICRKHNVIFILPYVALVQEKVWALSPFGVALDFLIEEYAAGKGQCPPRKRRYKNSVFIATTEKALSLINSLVEHGRIQEIGLVVVDELHLIGEDKRGPKLETLLTKLIYLNEDIQIVGMSATIGNISDLSQFLNAEVYTRNFRPVELIEYVKCGDEIAKVNYNAYEDNLFESIKTVNFHYSDAVTKLDPDHLSGLVLEVIPEGSCLIFCPSKKNCENVTRLLCTLFLPKFKKHKAQERRQLLNALKSEANTLCDILRISVPFGIAYHHSGLTSEERKLVEEAFRTGILSVICCTSTLAAGVNLPAKRVIIRKPYIAQDFISLSRYKQMIGRAGRAGLGELGESILICNKNELPKVKEMLTLPMDQTMTKMHDNDGIHLRDLFLSCISLQTASTKSQLENVTSKTLLAVQKEKLTIDLKSIIKKVLSDLFILGAVKISKDSEKHQQQSQSLNISVYSNVTDISSNSSKKSTKQRIVINNDTKLMVTKLGCAAIKGGLDMCSALTLYEDLLQAQESLVLIDCLHLLYLVTPYNLGDQIKPLKDHYHNIMLRIGEKERKTALILGINESCIVRMLSNKTVKNVPERVLNRFYMALMLYDLWNEVSVIDVSEKYQVTRGIVQNMMTSASTFAANVVSFCEELEEFWSFAHLLKGMCQRLSHCCTKELLPLMELPAVKQCRAKQLYGAGFKTLQSIAKANEQDLTESIEFMSRKLASQLIAAAKLLLLQKIETLREEAEDVLDGVENPLFFFNQQIVK